MITVLCIYLLNDKRRPGFDNRAGTYRREVALLCSAKTLHDSRVFDANTQTQMLRIAQMGS